ncbi:hypothetical protein PG996_012662 [Apiospora saccharicola]|uniref:Apple domain-containing protein n=1 Tax=Apiospora saccharicola TaxID=335842 RepID=A0ABR1U5B2_9PEZI
MWTAGIFIILNLAVALAGAEQHTGNGVCVNGTTIGTIQDFQVFCSSTARGRRTTSMDMPTLEECADACARANPRCTAATFDGKSCAFHNKTDGPLTAQNKNSKFTAVVGLPKDSSSNCRQIIQATTKQTINSVQFDIMCGSTLNSESLSNSYAASLQDCMGQCAKTSLCKAVSFNADQTLGFQNCFLKSKESKAALSVATMLDTAIVVKPKDVDHKTVANDGNDGNELVANKDNDNSGTNIMIIVVVSVSGFVLLLSLGMLCWWVHRRRTRQKRLDSLPVGVMPISYRDRMDEKYGMRTTVDWDEFDRKSMLGGQAETIGKPTPVYEIRRKGDSYHA